VGKTATEKIYMKEETKQKNNCFAPRPMTKNKPLPSAVVLLGSEAKQQTD
jgi:hypothetical protein